MEVWRTVKVHSLCSTRAAGRLGEYTAVCCPSSLAEASTRAADDMTSDVTHQYSDKQRYKKRKQFQTLRR